MLAKPRVEIWFELETRCNLRCKFCYNYWKSGEELAPVRLSTSDTLACLQRLLDVVTCSQFGISGGEPLLREDLDQILAFLKTRGIPMILTTNSTLLTRERVRHLVRLGIVSFQVPLHSPDPSIHDRLSGRECWDATMRSLVLLRESSAPVTCVFVATRLNCSHFAAVCELVGMLGIRSVIFNRFIPSGLGLRHRDEIGVPTDTELLAALMDANPIAQEAGVSIHLGNPIAIPSDLKVTLSGVSEASCPVRSGQRRWTIGSDGSIRRCNHSSASIGVLGHGGEERLLAELNAPHRSNFEYQGCQLGTLIPISLRPKQVNFRGPVA